LCSHCTRCFDYAKCSRIIRIKKPDLWKLIIKYMNTIIVYKTRLGGSKLYAEWLSEALKAPLMTFEAAGTEALAAADSVAVISGTYAGRMPLKGFIKKHWSILKDKKVAAVALGGIGPDHGWSKFSYWLLPRKIKKHVRYFKIPGRLEGGKPVEWGELKREHLEPVISYLKK